MCPNDARRFLQQDKQVRAAAELLGGQERAQAVGGGGGGEGIKSLRSAASTDAAVLLFASRLVSRW